MCLAYYYNKPLKHIHMGIRYLFQGVEVDAKTREYVQKKIESVEKMLDEAVDAEVEIDKDKKGFYRVEVMVKTPKDLFRSEQVSESIEGSVDMAEEEVKEQVRHKKDKLATMQRRGGRSIKKKMVIDEGARF